MAGSDLITMIGLNVISKFILSSGLGADDNGYCGPCGLDVWRLQSSDNEHYVGGAISGGKYAEAGMVDTAGDISASDGIGILRRGERRASISPPLVCTVISE
jgi:hypothetical protein